MLIDRYTKIVLTIIAIALSIIALNPWMAQSPQAANAQEQPMTRGERQLMEQIGLAVDRIDKNVMNIVGGKCSNPKIC